ncbi:MAG: prenyltransferase/squalene oxidase repeat-containing protein [Chloroflexota bacterium]
MSDFSNDIYGLLKEIGPGRMSTTAYDTAWVARMIEVEPRLSNEALAWLSSHQLPDGSWGAKEVHYYHDQVICTLAAMIALTYRGRRASDRLQIERGLDALERISAGATQGLASAPNGATVGFEMIAPTLVAEAERLGIIKQQGDRILGRLANLRKAKMAKLAGLKISRHITPAFSSEMAGLDHIDLLHIEQLQEKNGSVANSPAASAYFASYVSKGNEAALSYLRNVVQSDGGTPFAAPFDLFERSWVLWNLALAMPTMTKEMKQLCEPHLTHIQKNWDVRSGISFSDTYTPKDGDDTSLAYSVLCQFGIPVDIRSVLNYEDEEYFRCYPLETDASISVNIHVLEALKQAGFEANHPSVVKVLNFLRANQVESAFWRDKWHSSPFYSTSHAIIAAHKYDHDMCDQAVKWILQKQKSDGSWGIFPGVSTAEETAYCIQALKVWEQNGGQFSRVRIEQATYWLEKHSTPPYPPLWIGKVLYSPENVVRSTILSAMLLARQ